MKDYQKEMSELQGESNSISNQENFLEDYARKRMAL